MNGVLNIYRRKGKKNTENESFFNYLTIKMLWLGLYTWWTTICAKVTWIKAKLTTKNTANNPPRISTTNSIQCHRNEDTIKINSFAQYKHKVNWNQYTLTHDEQTLYPKNAFGSNIRRVALLKLFWHLVKYKTGIATSKSNIYSFFFCA